MIDFVEICFKAQNISAAALNRVMSQDARETKNGRLRNIWKSWELNDILLKKKWEPCEWNGGAF